MRTNGEYRVGDALEELKELPNDSAHLIHLDDAWSRPMRYNGMGVEYDTHDLETSFKIVDACWECLADGGWFVADADDWS